MKKLFIFLVFISSALIINGQNITFSTGFVKQNRAKAQAVFVDIKGADLDIAKAFSQWMADHYDYGLDGSKIIENRDHVYSALGAVIPEISEEMIDLHMMVIKQGPKKMRLKFYASYGFDVFFTNEKYPFQFRNLYAIVKQFIYEYFHTDKKISFASI